MAEEHKTQNEIRNALTDAGMFFRANVGRGWTGDVIRRSGDHLVLKDYRPFDTGLPAGFSDLFGLRQITITPDMVGQTIGVFTAIEVKAPKGRTSMRQGRFLTAVNMLGGYAGVARSVDDALRIARVK